MRHVFERRERALASPERQLWCAVVARALQDAIDPRDLRGEDEARRRVKENALDWFLRSDSDYQFACDGAGIDAEHLRDRVLSLAGIDAAPPEATLPDDR